MNILLYHIILQALFSAEGLGSLPWYVYLGAGGLLFLFVNTVARIATETLKGMEDEEAAAKAAASGLNDSNNSSNSSDTNIKL